MIEVRIAMRFLFDLFNAAPILMEESELECKETGCWPFQCF
jgi:hypothetical protein